MNKNKLNSREFEIYCVNKHNIETKQESYHWSNIPEELLYESGFISKYFGSYKELRQKRLNDKKENLVNSVQEYGLDGMSLEITEDNEKIYHGLQMKLWDYRRKIDANHLGTFLNVVYDGLKSNNYKSKGYLYYTCKLSETMEILWKKSGNVIPIKLKNPYEEEKQPEIKETEKELRYYQKEAIEKLHENWSGVKLLNLPCGTGKTLIVANYLKNSDYKNIFIFSPLKVHVKQNLDRISEFLPDYKKLLLDSDSTTNFKNVETLLNEKSIISTTFDSAENVLCKLFYDFSDEEFDEEEFDENSNEEEDFDNETEISDDSKFEEKYELSNSILIVDEAHNILNNKRLIKIINSFSKVLLMTATAPNQMKEILNCDTIYQYKLGQALKDKFICDYKIYLPLIENKDGIDIVDIDQPEELLELDNNICKKGLFLINGMLQTGSRKCIVYLNSIGECDELKIIIEKIMSDYHGLPCWVEILTSECSQNKREEIIKDFQFEKDNERKDIIKIILSIRILNEGIDIVKCDSIFIGNVGEKTNDIVTLQRICRANRLDKDNINKIAKCFLWCDNDWNKTINALQLLKENDIEFNKKINIIGSNYEKNDIVENIEKININNKNYLEYINVKCLSYEDIWEMKKNLLFEFVDEYKRCPKANENYKNYLLGVWYYNQKSSINNITDTKYIKLSKNSIIKESLEHLLIIKDNNKNKIKLSWNEYKELLIEFCNKYNRSVRHREIYHQYNIGLWLYQQSKLINDITDIKYKVLSENIFIKKSLDKYINYKKSNKLRLKFDESIEILIEFSNKYKKTPIQSDIYNNYKIGRFFDRFKLEIYNELKNNNNNLYNTIKDNKYIKHTIDSYIMTKQNNNKLTFNELVILLNEFTENFNRVPCSTDVYKTYKIGIMFYRLKYKEISTENYNILSKNILIKKYIDTYLNKPINTEIKKKKYTFDESKTLLFELCDTYKRQVLINEKYKNYNIYRWLYDQSRQINNEENIKYKLLSRNIYVKETIDSLIKERDISKNKVTLKLEDSINLLFEYCQNKHTTPIATTKYNNYNIGMFLHDKKKKITKSTDELYIKLSQNEYVKKSLDDYLEKKNKKVTVV